MFQEITKNGRHVGWWLVGCISQDTYLLYLSQPHSGEEGEDQTAELGEEAEPDEAGQDGFGV